MAVSLPLAILAAAVLIAINETGHSRSMAALSSMTQVQQTRSGVTQLLQHMLDAETGQRGYLLTGDVRYLEPYESATSVIAQNLDELRSLYLQHPRELDLFAELSRNVQRKLAEMDVSVRLRKQGHEDAWKFVLSTDVGQEHMNAIREQSAQLLQAAMLRQAAGEAQITQALQLSRIGIALVAMVGLLAFYMYLRQTRRLQAVDQRVQEDLQRERDLLGQQVKERTATLAELATHLQEVRERERGHLARELHDELGALLTAAKLDVARLKSRLGADSPDALQRIQHLTDTLNSGIALKRRIIEDLRPSSLTNLGLVTSLEILAREFGERSVLPVTTNLEHVELDEAAQLTVYRLVQESLTNIGKYARAKQVHVSVQNYGSHVTVEVQDDGEGFDTSRTAPAASHGLAGMRHRVEAAGGRLAISSTLGQGTRVSATLPVGARPPRAGA
ncbi:CHASE3 domain-containing protein [Pseudorhodoferax sp. Leaf274]|uniref:CHASE3 domain-containing protein n=1 Tax=Pseudorhodoferax sp. Leaf274 TaxID=1736318 RepID=UPI00070393F8|nr:CHASE3 domain-containing protein [Pseudorhodoferax sp. Leaf274]KQP37602.1 histidine kinase [Pseudorhodoferax sp. Leaf274]